MTLLMTRRASAILRVAAATARAESDAWEREANREPDHLTALEFTECAKNCWYDAKRLDAHALIAEDLCTRCGERPGDVLTDDGASVCAQCAAEHLPCGEQDPHCADTDALDDAAQGAAGIAAGTKPWTDAERLDWYFGQRRYSLRQYCGGFLLHDTDTGGPYPKVIRHSDASTEFPTLRDAIDAARVRADGNNAVCGQCDARLAEVVSPDCVDVADALASPLVCRECACDSEQAATDEQRERGKGMP